MPRESTMRVGVLRDLLIECACGTPLVGCEWELLVEPSKGYALFVKGYCTRGCGLQRAMFLSEEPPTPGEWEDRTKAEVERVLAEAMRIRREVAAAET